MKYLFACFLFLLTINLQAQSLESIETAWSNSFEDWEIETDIGSGELEAVWGIETFGRNGDINRWRYRIGDFEGEIYPKWSDDPSQWEIRSNQGTTITARTKWKDDYREWRITNNSFSIDLKQKWSNDSNEWVAENSYGRLRIKTEWSNDPRAWEIDDQLDMDIHIKLAIVFLAIFNSEFQ